MEINTWGKCPYCFKTVDSGGCSCQANIFQSDKTVLTCCDNFRTCHPDYNYCPKCGKKLTPTR